MQKRSVCRSDVPCLAHIEQGSGPLHPEHLPPSLSAWGNGDSVYKQPSRRMDLDSGVEICNQPNPDPVIPDKVCWNHLYFHLEYCLWSAYQMMVCVVLIVVILLGWLTTTRNKRVHYVHSSHFPGCVANTHNHTLLQLLHTIIIFLVKSTKSLCIHNWVTRLCFLVLQQMSPSLLLSQSRLSLPIHHVPLGRLNCLAWLFSAWLAQILLLIKVPEFKHLSITQIHIAVKTTQITARQLYLHTFLLFSRFHTGQLKKPAGPESFCWAQC
jgi:hypothetical protein